MTGVRWWEVLVLSLLLSPACDGRHLGVSGDGGVLPTPDARPGADAMVRPDGGADGPFGTLRLTHEVQSGDYPYEEVTFSAFFYAVNYVPPEPEDAGFVERRLTPDGVECDLYFTSPDWGYRPPSPDPPAPTPINAGELQLGGIGDSADALVTRWDGTGYVPDRRYWSANGGDWPSWMTRVELQVAIAGLGSEQVPPFADQVAVVDVPAIEDPGPDETVFPNDAGDFLLAWSADPDAAVEVRLDMNMDWDNAVLRCYPPATQTSLLLPQDWMNDYSWGWAELRVITLQNTWRVLPGVTVMVQARRSTHQSNEFQIVW